MSHLDSLKQNPEFAKSYYREHFRVTTINTIIELMEDKGVSTAELARQLGKEEKFICDLKSGGEALTLELIVDIFSALGEVPVVCREC